METQVSIAPPKVKRILVTGGPNVGKTTLALRMGLTHSVPVKSGDDLIKKRDWSEASEEISNWFDEPGGWIIEGVQIPRALRKWMARNPKGPLPFDELMYGRVPHQLPTKGQNAMTKGLETVWNEILPHLRFRGATIIYF